MDRGNLRFAIATDRALPAHGSARLVMSTSWQRRILDRSFMRGERQIENHRIAQAILSAIRSDISFMSIRSAAMSRSAISTTTFSLRISSPFL